MLSRAGAVKRRSDRLRAPWERLGWRAGRVGRGRVVMTPVEADAGSSVGGPARALGSSSASCGCYVRGVRARDDDGRRVDPGGGGAGGVDLGVVGPSPGRPGGAEGVEGGARSVRGRRRSVRAAAARHGDDQREQCSPHSWGILREPRPIHLSQLHPGRSPPAPPGVEAGPGDDRTWPEEEIRGTAARSPERRSAAWSRRAPLD